MEDKIFFNPGDIVRLNKEIPNAPVMYVVGKKTMMIRPGEGASQEEKRKFLNGIICRWFTISGELQEAVFSTKDIMLIKAASN